MQSSLAQHIALTFLSTFFAMHYLPLLHSFAIAPASIDHDLRWRISPRGGMMMTSIASGKPLHIKFVTGNKKKAEEVRRILVGGPGNSDIRTPQFVISNQKLDLPELQGEPVDVAVKKCRLAAEKVCGHVMIEDTSLCFNALNGLPGVYIKWFLEKCGHDGLNNMLVGFEDKSAYAQTVVAYCPGPGSNTISFTGKTDGTIVHARGPLDFGWDPIFEPSEGNGLTYAEMTKEGKDAISHRSRAFEKLAKYLAEEE